jgi:hypothetical protein
MSLRNPVQMPHDQPEPAMRVLHRFTKPDGHWAEIRSRNVNPFDALEFDVFVNGSLLVSQVFESGREDEYLAALASRIAQLLEEGWVEESG